MRSFISIHVINNPFHLDKRQKDKLSRSTTLDYPLYVKTRTGHFFVVVYRSANRLRTLSVASIEEELHSIRFVFCLFIQIAPDGRQTAQLRSDVRGWLRWQSFLLQR